MYSTCTFSKMEDEDNIQEFLDNHSEFSLERIYDYEGFTRAFGMEEAVRIFPHKMQGEGHFVALLHKEGELVTDVFCGNGKAPKIPAEIKEFLDEFNVPIDVSTIEIQGEKVYIMPKEVDNLKGLRVLRSGLLLGELKKNRFEPSQAFAMTIKPENYSTVLDFDGDSPTVIKYLKGETIETEDGRLRGKSKNVLITVCNHPLGWGKLSNGTVKNKYLPGWRWM